MKILNCHEVVDNWIIFCFLHISLSKKVPRSKRQELECRSIITENSKLFDHLRLFSEKVVADFPSSKILDGSQQKRFNFKNVSVQLWAQLQFYSDKFRVSSLMDLILQQPKTSKLLIIKGYDISIHGGSTSTPISVKCCNTFLLFGDLSLSLICCSLTQTAWLLRFAIYDRE